MDAAAQTMINNLEAKTGKSLEEWVQIVKKENFEKHGQIIKFLKENHEFTHGFANLVAHKARQSDAGSVEDKSSLVDQQYAGKESLRPIYDQLMKQIESLGDDVEIAPKKAYVSLRRKKQFAMLTPATKSRFEVALNLKGVEASGILEEVTSKNAMCSHKIKITSTDEITDELLNWVRSAYDQAG